MEWFFDKIGNFKSGGTVAFFLFVNAFLYADIISIIYYAAKMFENIQKISIREILILIIGFLSLFYILKLVRSLILTFVIHRFSKTETYLEYYKLDELLDESIREDNSVKYEVYRALESNQKTKNETRLLVFVTVILSLIEVCYKHSIIRDLLDYKWLQPVLLFLFLFFLIYALQQDEDRYSPTLIKKE